MPAYDVTIFLAGGATAKIHTEVDKFETIRDLIENQLGKDEFELKSDQTTATLIIKYPAINIVGYVIDETA